MAGIGPTLRSAREGRGLSIELVAQETRISPRFLEALEDERFEALPAPVYVRGFLRSYANYLHIDAAQMMNELNAREGARVAGPDGFVSGSPPRPPARDPWRQRPQAGPRVRNSPPPPAAPAVMSPPSGEDTWAPEESDDSWAPEPAGYAPQLAVPAVDDDYAPEETSAPDVEYELEEPGFRPRRVSGVLVEREVEYNEAGGPMRTIALAGGALFALVFFGIVGLLILKGGGSDNSGDSSRAAVGSETVSNRTGTQVSVGTAVSTATATAAVTSTTSATTSPSVTVTGTPGTATPSATPDTPTSTPPPIATPRPGEATPTATLEPPTPLPPTATPVPPTQRPPTPVPTPIISHPSGTSECSQFGGACGRPGPSGGAIYLVVCAPDGWFIDAPGNGDFTGDGGVWPRRTSSSVSGAATVCG